MCSVIGCVVKQLETISGDDSVDVSVVHGFESFALDLLDIAARPYRKQASTDSIVYFQSLTDFFTCVTSLLPPLPGDAMVKRFAQFVIAITEWPTSEGTGSPFVSRQEAVQAVCSSANTIITLLNAIDVIIDCSSTAPSESGDVSDDDMAFRQRSRPPLAHGAVAVLGPRQEVIALDALHALRALILATPLAGPLVLDNNANVAIHCLQIRDDTPLASVAVDVLAEVAILAAQSSLPIDDLLDVGLLVESIAGLHDWLTTNGYRDRDKILRNRVLELALTLAGTDAAALLADPDVGLGRVLLSIPGMPDAPTPPPAQMTPGPVNHAGQILGLQVAVTVALADPDFMTAAVAAGLIDLLLLIATRRTVTLPFKWSRQQTVASQLAALHLLTVLAPEAGPALVEADGVRTALSLAPDADPALLSGLLDLLSSDPRGLAPHIAEADGIGTLTSAAGPTLPPKLRAAVLGTCGVLLGALDPSHPSAATSRADLQAAIPQAMVTGIRTANPVDAAGVLTAIAGAADPMTGSLGARLEAMEVVPELVAATESAHPAVRPLLLAVLADLTRSTANSEQMVEAGAIGVIADLAAAEDKAAGCLDADGHTIDPTQPLGHRPAPIHTGGDPTGGAALDAAAQDLRPKLHVLLTALELVPPVGPPLTEAQQLALVRVRAYPQLRAIEIRHTNQLALSEAGVRPTSPDQTFLNDRVAQASHMVLDMARQVADTRANIQAIEEEEEAMFYRTIIDNFDRTAEGLRQTVAIKHSGP